ncbi:hypothetical protein A3Q56_08383, partial [Intoshia linei]
NLIKSKKYFNTPRIWTVPNCKGDCYYCYAYENSNLKKMNNWKIYPTLPSSTIPYINESKEKARKDFKKMVRGPPLIKVNIVLI